MSSFQAITTQIAEHERQVAALRAQAETLRTAERSEVIRLIRGQIADYGLTASDIGLGKRGSKAKPSATKVAPQYFNPNGPESWSGRGRKPLWVIAAQAKGHSLESLRKAQAGQAAQGTP